MQYNISGVSNFIEAVGPNAYSEGKKIEYTNVLGLANLETKTINTHIAKIIDNNIIVTMTGNNEPAAQIASSSSTIDPANDAWCAFANDISKTWVSAIGTGDNSEWIQIQFDSPKQPHKCKITGRQDGDANVYGASRMLVQCSNDGTSWEDVAEWFSDAQWVAGQEIFIDFSYIPNHSYFRFYIDGNDKGEHVAIGNIELYEQDRGKIITDVEISDGNTLIVSQDGANFTEIIATGVTGSGPYELDISSIVGNNTIHYVGNISNQLSINYFNAVEKNKIITLNQYDTDTFGDKKIDFLLNCNNGIIDETGNYNLEVVGNVKIVPGLQGKAVRFVDDGNLSYIKDPNNSLMTGTIDAVTFNFWTRTTQTSPAGVDNMYTLPMFLGANGVWNDYGFFAIVNDNGYIGVTQKLRSDREITTREIVKINDGKWRMITFVSINNKKTFLYVDGEYVSNLDGAYPPSNIFSKSIGIGGYQGYYTTPPLDADIALVKMYKRAYSEQAIKSLYKNEISIVTQYDNIVFNEEQSYVQPKIIFGAEGNKLCSFKYTEMISI